MIIQQIKDSLPKYRYLTPGVDVWREGDEYCLTETVKLAKPGWQKIGSGAVGLELPTKDCEMHGGWFIVETVIGIGVRIASDYVARRPIPDEVLENQAFWVLYNKLATVAPNGEGFDVCYHKLLAVYDLSTGNGMNGKRLFESQDAYHKAIPLLGGEQNIIKHLSAGDLYSKWLGEQLT